METVGYVVVGWIYRGLSRVVEQVHSKIEINVVDSRQLCKQPDPGHSTDQGLGVRRVERRWAQGICGNEGRQERNE